MFEGLCVDVIVVGKMVPVLPNLSRTVSIGVVNPVGPNPMNPVPEPLDIETGGNLI